jgi:hypothetical protein
VHEEVVGNWAKIVGDGTGYSEGERFTIFLYKYHNNAIKIASMTQDPEILNILDQILTTFEFSDNSSGVESSWQTYTNPTIGYSIQYPSGWRKQEWDSGIGFGPKEIGEDVILGISYYSKEDTEPSNFIDKIGSQFADRVVVRD